MVTFQLMGNFHFLTVPAFPSFPLYISVAHVSCDLRDGMGCSKRPILPRPGDCGSCRVWTIMIWERAATSTSSARSASRQSLGEIKHSQLPEVSFCQSLGHTDKKSSWKVRKQPKDLDCNLLRTEAPPPSHAQLQPTSTEPPPLP